MSQMQFTGRTAAEAAIQACDRLGLTRPELKYDVVDDVGEGLTRSVTIAVHDVPARRESEPEAPQRLPFERPMDEPLDEDDEPPRRDEVSSDSRPVGAGGRGRGAPRTARGRAPARRPERGERSDRGDRPERSARSERAERGDSPPPGRTPRANDRGRQSTASSSERGVRPERPERSERGDRPERRPRRGEGDGERRPRSAPRGPSLDTLLQLREAPSEVSPLPAVKAQSTRAQQAVEVIRELTTRMDMQVDVALVQEDEGELHVHIHGKDEKKTIGQRGEVLLALQFVANRLLGRAEQEDEADQVLVLDAGGHRQRRRVAIESLARALAERALVEGKGVRLSPMSAHDRRIVHVALQDMEGIATQSEGDGLLRNLLIVPAALCS